MVSSWSSSVLLDELWLCPGVPPENFTLFLDLCEQERWCIYIYLHIMRKLNLFVPVCLQRFVFHPQNKFNILLFCAVFCSTALHPSASLLWPNSQFYNLYVFFSVNVLSLQHPACVTHICRTTVSKKEILTARLAPDLDPYKCEIWLPSSNLASICISQSALKRTHHQLSSWALVVPPTFSIHH